MVFGKCVVFGNSTDRNFYASVSKGAASSSFYTFGMVQPPNLNL